MKKTFAILLCVFSIAAANGQYVGLSLGYAIPARSFGKQQLNETDNGFATTGYSFGLVANYQLYKNLGICAEINKVSFGFDANTYSRLLNEANPLSQFDVTAEKYRINLALAGINGTVGNNHLAFGIQIMGGFVHMTTPEKRITQQYVSKNYLTIVDSRSDLAPAFCWGVSGTYHLNHYLYLLLNVHNVLSATEFSFDYYSNTNQPQSLPLNYFSVALGLGIAIQ